MVLCMLAGGWMSSHASYSTLGCATYLETIPTDAFRPLALPAGLAGDLAEDPGAGGWPVRRSTGATSR